MASKDFIVKNGLRIGGSSGTGSSGSDVDITLQVGDETFQVYIDGYI